MKYRFLLFWFMVTAMLMAKPAYALIPEKETSKEGYTVYIFLSETCPISQFYTLTLKNIYKEFSGSRFTFEGIFPNSYSTLGSIADFKNKYSLPFELKPDPEQKLTAALKATITPEVVILNTETNTIAYRGRIDDAYFRVGKRRAKVNEPDLKIALTELQQNRKVTKPETAAVGCYITLKP